MGMIFFGESFFSGTAGAASFFVFSFFGFFGCFSFFGFFSFFCFFSFFLPFLPFLSISSRICLFSSDSFSWSFSSSSSSSSVNKSSNLAKNPFFSFFCSASSAISAPAAFSISMISEDSGSALLSSALSCCPGNAPASKASSSSSEVPVVSVSAASDTGFSDTGFSDTGFSDTGFSATGSVDVKGSHESTGSVVSVVSTGSSFVFFLNLSKNPSFFSFFFLRPRLPFFCSSVVTSSAVSPAGCGLT